MSIHFAPQWVKPIKPTGSSITPTSDIVPQPVKPLVTPTIASVPFPALTQSQRSSSPSTVTSHNPALSYSRVTHPPLSPSNPNDSSYFPQTDGNGVGDPHPFRYSRDQILGMWDEDKYKIMPIELVEMADAGGVLVRKGLTKPAGLGEMSELQKKLLATSIHPPLPSRRPPTANGNGEIGGNSTPIRRPNGPPVNGKESPVVNGRGGAFGGFGRGEGGAFGSGISRIGGGLAGMGTGDSKPPGTLGGGFGGLGRKPGRTRTESGDINIESPRPAPNWRTNRTTSGNFEGVLGFSGIAPATVAPLPQTAASGPSSPEQPLPPVATDNPPHTAPASSWRERYGDGQRDSRELVAVDREVEPSTFGSGGGPGWGTGQKKWRLAAGLNDKSTTLDIPGTSERQSESVMATASGTPVPERDASMADTLPLLPSQADQLPNIPPPQPQQEKEDLGIVNWYYRDPNGQEQGPFTGNQMHEWYSHSYFTDDLPLRRQSETTFQTLAELKAATGNAVQPFLSPIRPRNLPPNLPLPLSALQVNGHLTDALKTLAVQSPSAQTRLPEVNMALVSALAFDRYQPDRHAPVPSPYSPQSNLGNHLASPTGQFSPVQAQSWGSMVSQNYPPRPSPAFASPSVLSPIGSAAFPYNPLPQQSVYSPAVGPPAQRELRSEFFSPTAGVVGSQPSPWSMPPPPQTPSYHSQQHHTAELPTWQPPQPQYHTQPQQYLTPLPLPTAAGPTSPAEEAPYYVPSHDLDDVISTDENHMLENESFAESTSEVGEEVERTKIESGSTDSEPAVETPTQAASPPAERAEPITAKPIPSAVQSVWGKTSTPSSRKSSIAVPANAIAASDTSIPWSAQSITLPSAPSSLPSKPATARQPSTAEVIKTAVAPAEKSTQANKPAPWAVAKEEKEGRISTNGLSIRDIQEAEAKVTEARRQALAALRTASPVATPSVDDIHTSMSWGLPSQGTKSNAPAPSPTPTTPSAVWGSGDAGPKRTLKQIQEEEEKRRQRVAAQAKATQMAAGLAAGPKRGYADLAANASAAQAAVARSGWTTVGTTSKAASPLPAPKPAAAAIVKSSTIAAKPSASPIPSPAPKSSKANGVDEFSPPSVEFIKWTKTALTGLNVNLDEFIQMLLSFPIDPPSANRGDTLEIISDSVYAHSSTLDGRRFAQEFFNKRKVDAMRPKDGFGSGIKKSASAVMTSTSLADVVKSVPKKSEDAGFRIVKAKGKKKN